MAKPRSRRSITRARLLSGALLAVGCADRAPPALWPEPPPPTLATPIGKPQADAGPVSVGSTAQTGTLPGDGADAQNPVTVAGGGSASPAPAAGTSDPEDGAVPIGRD